MATRWAGRVLVAGVFLFWGGFFVEHLQEWFTRPFPGHPPLKVCAAMALHFLILAGLIAALLLLACWWRERKTRPKAAAENHPPQSCET